MAIPIVGRGGVIGIGVESTWGTAVSRTNWKDMRSMGLHRMVTHTPYGHLGYPGQVSSNHRGSFIESDFAGGPLSFDMAYDDSTLLLLYHLMGKVTDSGASAPYTHAFEIADPLPTGLTIEQISGQHASVNHAEVFEGCKLNGGRIIIEAGNVVRIETEVLAETSGGLTSAGTPSMNSAPEYLTHHHATTKVLWNSTILPCSSLTFDIARNLVRRHEMGSKFTSEPHQEQGTEVTFELRCKWQEVATDADHLAGTLRSLDVTFTGTGDNTAQFTCDAAQIIEVTREVNSKGGIDKVIRGRCYATAGGHEGLDITITNDNSVYSAN